MGALAANRKVTAVAQATIATKIHQALDIHLHFTAKVTFNSEICVDMFPNREHFGVAEFVDPACSVNIYSFTDLLC